MVPHYKDGYYEVPNDNRTISLLPVLSWVAERIALGQFNHYLTTAVTKVESGRTTRQKLWAIASKRSHLQSHGYKVNYGNGAFKLWVPPTKPFFGSKVIFQTDNSPLVLQFHCQNYSLLHMTYLRAQFSAQRSLVCTWMIKFSNIKSYVDDTKIYFSLASKKIDSCLRQVAEDLKHVHSGVGLITFWSILKKPSLPCLG